MLPYKDSVVNVNITVMKVNARVLLLFRQYLKICIKSQAPLLCIDSFQPYFPRRL